MKSNAYVLMLLAFILTAALLSGATLSAQDYDRGHHQRPCD
jgi:hypothetical protein